MGDLRLSFEHEGEAEAYRRDLDLDTAMASVSYRVGETNSGENSLPARPTKPWSCG